MCETMGRHKELRFIRVAQAVAEMSKNPKRKIGAVILSKDMAIVATGYNGLARGVEDSAGRYEHPAKSYLMVHAEANAIFQAARTGATTDGCSMLITGLQPCAQCASAIVQAGIKKVFYPHSAGAEQKWSESFAFAEQAFYESGVEVFLYEGQ